MVVLDLSIYRYLFLPLVAVLSSAVACVASCGCIACLLSALWYPCRSCGRPMACSRSYLLRACSCSDSCRLSCLLSVACLPWPPPAPVGTLRRSTNRGGVIFQKGGRGRPKPTPSPFSCARSKKMWFSSEKVVLWCDFGQLIERSVLFLALFGWLRWLCCVILGS